MRVTILTRSFPPARSGIGEHADHLANELAILGHAVTVVCSGPAHERAMFDVQPVVESWGPGGVSQIAAAVDQSKPDVVLWQYNPFELGPRGRATGAAPIAKAMSSRAPLVVYFHELWFPAGRGGLKGSIWARAQRRAAARVLKTANAAIVTTQERARALTGRVPSIAQIPVGTNIPPTGRRSRGRFALPEGAFVIAHLGATGHGRDLGPAFEAVRIARAGDLDARLLLIGAEHPLRIPTDVQDAVVTTARISAIEVSDALASADVYLHPDHAGPSAGRRTSLVAALAHGLPIVSYRGPDHAEQLVDGRSIVVADGTGPALAEAFTRLHADADVRASLGAAAQAAFEQHFSWHRIGAAVSDVLAEVAQ